MKIIILKGGLGNQLFQVSYACYLAKRKQQRIILFTGLLGSYQTKRPFYFADYFGSAQEHIKIRTSYLLAYLLRIFAFIIEPVFPKLIFMESSKKYSKEQSLSSAFIIDAYLQSFSDPAYFHFLLHDPYFANFIKTSLSPFLEQWHKDIVVKTSCLHIRGTDLKYLFNEAQLKMEVKQVLSKLVNVQSNETVTVVTDDIPYARSLLDPMVPVDFQSENWQIDFLTLAHARFMGLIDSTFSIWAGLYGLIVFQGNIMVTSINCIQKYPLLVYLHQEKKIKSLEDVEWR